MNDDLYVCAMCLELFEKDRPDSEAMRESEAKFGHLDPSEIEVVCDHCYAWMADVERIARRLAGQSHHNPDQLVQTRQGPVPVWSKFVGIAKTKTTKPKPGTNHD